MHQGQASLAPGANGSPINATSVDDLIASASKSAAATATSTAVEKKGKKVAKPTRLVYTDEGVSPEAKKALLGRYAFTPDRSVGTAIV